jgi:pilus assembly protein Flp/PilA
MILFKQFLCCETAATAVEYGLIAGLISVALIAGATAVGSTLSNFYLTRLAPAFQ